MVVSDTKFTLFFGNNINKIKEINDHDKITGERFKNSLASKFKCLNEE